MTNVDRIYTLTYSRSGLERLLAALDTAYLYSPSKTDDEAFAEAQMRRVEKLLNPKEPK